MKKATILLTMLTTLMISCSTNSDKTNQSADNKENPLFKKETESKEDFVKRLYPNIKLSHQVLEGNFGTNPLPKIIFFYEVPTKDTNFFTIKGVYLQKQDNGVYYPVTIGTIEEAEVDIAPNPHISAVFFDNADNDKENEIIVLQGRETRGGLIMGEEPVGEDTSVPNVFDDKEVKCADGLCLTKLDDVSKKLFDANVYNAKDTRNALKKMGY